MRKEQDNRHDYLLVQQAIEKMLGGPLKTLTLGASGSKKTLAQKFIDGIEEEEKNISTSRSVRILTLSEAQKFIDSIEEEAVLSEQEKNEGWEHLGTIPTPNSPTQVLKFKPTGK
jgi:hypothetical protein